MPGPTTLGVPAEVASCYSALDKAIKSVNLYMGKGALVANAIEAVTGELERYLAHNQSLAFDVSALGFLYADERLDTDDKPSPFYFYLFKDGVRELSFHPGITGDEIRQFIGILVEQRRRREQADEPQDGAAPKLMADLDVMDEDTVTRLWEADLPHVRYYAIDAFAAGEIYDPEKGTTRSLAELVRERMQTYRPETPSEASRRLGSLSGAQPAPELRSLGALSVAPPDPLPDDAVELWRRGAEADETLGLDRFAFVWARLVEDAEEEQLDSLEALMVQAFHTWQDDGRWDALVRGLKILRVLASTERHRPLVESILGEVGSAPSLDRLRLSIEDIDQGHIQPALTFFVALGPGAVEHLAKMLTDLPPGPVIEGFERGFVAAQIDPIQLHVARLGSTKSAVIRTAIDRLAAHLEVPAVIEALRPLLTRRDSDIRYLALRVLAEDPSEETRAALHRGLTDTSREIRAFAIKRLGELADEPSRAALLERVLSKDFKDLQAGERRLVLACLVRAGGDKAMGYFREQLKRKKLFGGKQLKAWQAELQRALGDAATDDAQALLAELGAGTAP